MSHPLPQIHAEIPICAVASLFPIGVINETAEPQKPEITDTQISGETRSLFTTVDSVVFRANSRAHLLEMLSQVHPVIADLKAPDQWYHDIVFRLKSDLS